MEISSLVSRPATKTTYQLPLRPASVEPKGAVSEPSAEANVKLPSIHDMLSDVQLGMQPSYFQPRTYTPSPVILPAPSTSSPMVVLQPVGAYSYQQHVFPASPQPQSSLCRTSTVNSPLERSVVASLPSPPPSSTSTSISSTATARRPVSPGPRTEKKIAKPGLVGSTVSDSKKRRSNLPKRTTTILSDWLVNNLNHPYPNPRQKLELIEQTGLTSQQLSNWFINARRRKINILREVQNNTRETV
ncbi:Homeodomain-containing protein and putative transcription factor [Komagataella phaffii CBS 7435]|uniref:Homeodomain-containing transcriptional repressor of PTR2 n=2 Tax=Komagataella phaffii TaxID=460519 RepID=C4R502_KOMPG|nr:Homeodomain-containing transcriptional repressor of PTR2 [Komagataella phaffii GS115]AOA64157.1 GQ67_03666T0 [Komagataella phaffii]CAH2449594.1 Homeodomain-containing protein and putative transcription factor [Komagataella phaffii CBS 7435]AOA68896.1 GQ68_03638T0 [Komagataella phaffii GS115]CAY70638.1 Homeodomain-containing transcriptional repressor of PTR2 [Komagataella phaffii GS115]CCA39573.1 Homeodomain-containing protein and putative transcription factor [Komagataella phaffii CBS 7435]